jgi:opacity protein-like surface antigen
MNVYGLLGYGRTSIDYDSHTGRSSKLSKNGFSYGAGLEYDLTSDDNQGDYGRTFDGQGDQEKSWGVWVDFMHLLDGEGVFDTDSNIVTGGITYDF